MAVVLSTKMEKEITDYLHHRPPFLYLDKVLEDSPGHITTIKKITGEEYFCQGHFPGAPIVPGSVLHEMTTQTAGVLIAKHYNPMSNFNTYDPYHNEFALGVLHKTNYARFKGFARPQETLQIDVKLIDHKDNYFSFKGKISINEKLIMSNEFILCNIPSLTLQGK
jgi:3-hydroxyacyl-[acyl-carrier-protein] dehydratase